MIPAQLRNALLAPIRPGRVGEVPGKGGKKFSHVEAYELRAHLIRLFEFDGWDEVVTDMELVFESENAEHKWTVCYRACVELTIRWPSDWLDDSVTPGAVSKYTEWATGQSENQPSRGEAHDGALKTAESQAFKRAVVNLGDQFGLSLYKGGSKEPLVRQTRLSANAAAATTTVSADAPAVDEHVTESVPESEQVPAREDSHQQSAAATISAEVGIALDEDRNAEVASLVAQLNVCKTKSQVGMVSADIGKRKLLSAHTADGRTLGAVVDEALRRTHVVGAA